MDGLRRTMHNLKKFKEQKKIEMTSEQDFSLGLPVL